MSEQPWLIWSNEHRRWWRAGWSGYTDRIVEAGRYLEHVADQVCRDANFGGRFYECKVLAPEAVKEPTPALARALAAAAQSRPADGGWPS